MAHGIAGWVAAYTTAWDTNEPAAVAGLFTEDAEYRSYPWAPPACGVDDIVSLWLADADQAGDHRFTWREIGRDGDRHFVQGRTEYTDGRTYENLWIVVLAADGRATSFTEWYMESASKPLGPGASTTTDREAAGAALELPVLRGDRVRLRAFTVGDLPAVLGAAGDPLIPLITSVPSTADPAEARAYIERQHDRARTGAGYSFAIADETDRAVGQIGLWLRDIERGRVSIGYWIAPAARGQGCATDALRTISTWGERLPGVHRLELFVEPWNEGSWRAAERAGYRREGLLRSWQLVGTERRDMLAYSRVTQAVQG